MRNGIPIRARRPRRARIGVRSLAGIAVAVTIGLAITAVAVASPETGTYKATGAIAFRFSLSRGKCYLAPKNLKNFRARRGAYGTGFCFNSTSEPGVNPKCPDGASIDGDTASLDLFERLRLAGNGTLHVKAYTYASAAQPIGYTELDLTVKGAKATGYIRLTDEDGAGVSCDTGKLSFTARR